MRARSAFFAGVGSAAIVAIGWQAGVGTLVTSLPQSQASASGAVSSGGTAVTPVAAAVTGPADGTYDGAVINTRYGPQQVQVVFASGQLADVIVIQTQTADSKSKQISSRANPLLREEALTAQSANISNVSGATYTSESYIQSLQSALDAAGFTG
jgi:uncharacterized protein with FMN-binding domain